MQVRKSFLTLALLGLASAGIGGCGSPRPMSHREVISLSGVNGGLEVSAAEAGRFLKEYASIAGKPDTLEQTESRELVYNLSNPGTYQYTYIQRNAGIWRAREFAKKARENEPELAATLERHLDEIANSGI